MPPTRRPKAAIQNDPQATPEELHALKAKDPKAVLAHPNCPPSLWWELAARYPIEAQSSTVGKLFLLEDPARWAQLEEKNRISWIKKVAKALPLKERYLFSADCAERVLYLFKALYPNDTTPLEAIQVCRRFAKGEATEAQRSDALLAAKKVASQIAERARGLGRTYMRVGYSEAPAYWAAARVAYAAAFALQSERARGESTAWCAALAASARAEQRWQWTRLSQYVSGERAV